MYTTKGFKGVALAMGGVMLAGCAGNQYLDAPVPPESVSRSTTFDGRWNGIVGPLYRWRTLNSAHAVGKAIVCDDYKDNISLDVAQGNISIRVGSDPVYELTAQADENGYFYQSMPAGRQGLKSTAIWVTGQLSAAEAQGQVGFGPTGYSRGCLGAFVASRSDGNLLPEPVENPFTTDYYFIDVIERD
ncbi:hypothetical protein GCM10011348_46950 [Marinobacterium nitratireducens]|uniref:Uncharacterized protein n=1 Tax=Marinobacterium nitratireducens TaxID=518897 RepID=A0A918DXZ7_9GAMM|nr:hypothetical protein [Marinobacterium nitratireducens]GGO89361.1 hypothetical protein GCM10011348_46950 [Marinobacterium nitratireducens]